MEPCKLMDCLSRAFAAVEDEFQRVRYVRMEYEAWKSLASYACISPLEQTRLWGVRVYVGNTHRHGLVATVHGNSEFVVEVNDDIHGLLYRVSWLSS